MAQSGLNKEKIKEYEKLKESIIKNSFDPVAKEICSWDKEKAFRLTDYHFNTWIEIHGSIIDIYHKSYYWRSLLFLFFNSLFKEIYWIQLFFLWGNYRVINSNLRYILEEMALGYYIDHEFSTSDLDAKMEKAKEIDEKGVYGWNLLKLVLTDMGINENSKLENIKNIFWKPFHSYAHPKPIKLLEVSEIDPKSTVIDSFNEYFAEDCLSHIDASFDFVYSFIIFSFPDIIERLKKKGQFTNKRFKKLSPLAFSLINKYK